MRSPVTSQALSTEERKGRTGSPVPGQLVRTEPSCASYQLSQKPWWRSSFSTEATVRVRRRCSVSLSMTPRPAAATVAHSPHPMFVGDVFRETTGPPGRLRSSVSAARPMSVVMASIDR